MDRRKSFHEFSGGDSVEERCMSPSAYDRYHPFGSGGTSRGATSAGGRYEEEIMNAFYPSSAAYAAAFSANAQSLANELNHNRFEVYRTRAERAADAMGYRAPAAYYHGGGGGDASGRPMSAYIPNTAYRSPRMATTADEMFNHGGGGAEPSYTAPSSRRSFYDEHYQPPFESAYMMALPSDGVGGIPMASAASYNTAATALTQQPPDLPKEATAPGGGVFSRFRPVTRRLGAGGGTQSSVRGIGAGTAGVGGDMDMRRLRARSQSNEHMLSLFGGGGSPKDEFEFNGKLSDAHYTA